jgi:MoaA/NifB/PqqE/SkfB family radical SAM enzyme
VANKNIFCNTPWYEINIYWNGDLGICCQENRKLYPKDHPYNIKNISLKDWFNSPPVRQLRKDLLSDTKTDVCNKCYYEEAMGNSSRRHRSNQKSAIFTRTAFEDSYLQSPGYPHFEISRQQDGFTGTLPIDLHIDLGNYCNLACKMCDSKASSTIAVQLVKWGSEEDRQFLGNDWTKDQTVWDRVLNELLEIPKLKNIHFMGGETLLTSRIEDFVDFMTAHGRFDLCFSFVTNGTVFNQRLMDKLKKFSRVGIEVSIETATVHNDYIRQGSDTAVILSNIQKYKDNCDNSNISVTVRPAISALSIGYYYTLLEYCLEHKLLIKSLLVTRPNYLNVRVLPMEIRQQYLNNYQQLLNKLTAINIDDDYNESDLNNYEKSVKMQTLQALTLLNQEDPLDQKELLQDMVDYCAKWDKVYKFNAVELYPELADTFKNYGY